MLKHMILITMSVFGAATIAVAGMPITTMTMKPMTVSPELHRNARTSAPVQVTRPRLAPRIKRAAPAITAMPRLRRPERLPVQVNKPGKPGLIPRGSRTQPGIVSQRAAALKGMVISGRRPALRLVTPPDLMITKDPVKIDYRCIDLSKLIVVHEIVRNYGGPLAAYHGKTYVRETQLNGLLLGSPNLGSPEIPIPPMAHYADVKVTIPVGTTEAYREKLPGRHELRIYIAVNGKVVGHAILSIVEFPKGYCQSKGTQSAIVSQRSALKGMVISRSLHLPSLGIAAGSGTGGIATHGRLPDLIPQVSNPFSGIINVKNIGKATAGASKLTVNCEELGGGPGGDCPSNAALNSIPTDSSGALVESVPPLHAGQVYTISLPVQGLKWDLSKDYQFTYKADATHVVAESNEINNTLVSRVASMHNISKGSATHGPMPDLIPQVSDPFNGIIEVKNIGNATAGASTLTVNCKKIGSGFVASAGDCPSNAALNSLPTDASGALLISVHLLHAGQAQTITLPVKGLKWSKGKYQFTYKVNAGGAVAESDESNNVKTMVRQR